MHKQRFSTLLLLLVYVFNYLGINWYLGMSQMQLAETFPFPYMPDGIIFMVAWTTIYILLIGYIIYGWTDAGKNSKVYTAIQPRFQISCLLNIFWMITTGWERYIASVAIIRWLRATLGKILSLIHTHTPASDNKKSFRLVTIPFGIYYWRISLASSVVAISQLVYQRNESLTLWQTWSLIVVIIGLIVSVYSWYRRKNIWQLLVSIRAIWGILFALFL